VGAGRGAKNTLRSGLSACAVHAVFGEGCFFAFFAIGRVERGRRGAGGRFFQLFPLLPSFVAVWPVDLSGGHVGRVMAPGGGGKGEGVVGGGRKADGHFPLSSIATLTAGFLPRGWSTSIVDDLPSTSTPVGASQGDGDRFRCPLSRLGFRSTAWENDQPDRPGVQTVRVSLGQ